MTFLTILGLIYGLVVLSSLLIYLILFFRDFSTPTTDWSSWIVLGLASLFWPVVLPLSYLERQAKMQSLQNRWENIKPQKSHTFPLV